MKPYLTSLGTVANTPTYARIVSELARYRRLLEHAEALSAAVACFDDIAIDQAIKAIAAERDRMQSPQNCDRPGLAPRPVRHA